MTICRFFVANYNAFSATYKSFRDHQSEILSLSTILFYHVATKISRGNLIAFYHVHSFALIQHWREYRRLVASFSQPSLAALGKPSDKLNRCVHVHRRDAINSVHRVLDWSNELHHLHIVDDTSSTTASAFLHDVSMRPESKNNFFLLMIEIWLTHWSLQKFYNVHA